MKAIIEVEITDPDGKATDKELMKELKKWALVKANQKMSINNCPIVFNKIHSIHSLI